LGFLTVHCEWIVELFNFCKSYKVVVWKYLQSLFLYNFYHRVSGGAAQGNPRADSDQETGMNEPRYLLYTGRNEVQIQGSSDEL
jgi:hypothetical protein